MSAPLLLSFRTEIDRMTLGRPDGGESDTLVASWGGLPMPKPGTPERAAVDRLLQSPSSAAELEQIVTAAGSTGLARWMLWAGRARERGLLCFRLGAGGGVAMAEIVPVSPSAPNYLLAPPSFSAASRLQLSRFAHFLRGPSGMTVESPLANMRVELSSDAAAAITILAKPVSASDAAEHVRLTTACTAAESQTLIAVLRESRLLADVGEDGLLDEDRDATLVQWEFQDLLLHARSRTARPDERRGGTYRFAGTRPKPHAAAHPGSSPGDGGNDGGNPGDGHTARDNDRVAKRILLDRPNLDSLISNDPPFAQIIEERGSERTLGPLTAHQLSEFLYRTVGIRTFADGTDGANGADGALTHSRSHRPYPSAGGIYELTAYLAVGECDDLAPGLYRYDAVDHGLTLVSSRRSDVDRLLIESGHAAAMATRPPLLVILAADFGRLSWKYEGISYALVLKNVGVLMATMQLSAMAMGLGSCPLGAGDSELFARAAGTRAIEQSSVGELLLGSRAPAI